MQVKLRRVLFQNYFLKNSTFSGCPASSMKHGWTIFHALGKSIYESQIIFLKSFLNGDIVIDFYKQSFFGSNDDDYDCNCETPLEVYPLDHSA